MVEFFVDSVEFHKRTLLQFRQDVKQKVSGCLAHEVFSFILVEIALVKKRFERNNRAIVVGHKKVFTNNNVEFRWPSMAVSLAVNRVVVREKEIVGKYFYLCSPSRRNEFVHDKGVKGVGFLQIFDIFFFGIFNVDPRNLRPLNNVSHFSIVSDFAWGRQHHIHRVAN